MSDVEDYEFITREAWQHRVAELANNALGRLGWEDYRRLANEMLNEKAKRGYTHNYDVDFACDAISKETCEGDTHEAFVFLRPLKKEEPECDHNLKYLLDRSVGVSEEVVCARPDRSQFKFCPKCGKKLETGEE